MDKVPIIDITKDNFKQFWPSLLYSMKSSSFIALDLELSGIGNRKQISAKCMDDRYTSLCEVAKTRAVISLGISCFNQNKTEETLDSSFEFTVQTFNLLVLCSENYTVEPESLKFLVEHGFDFNRQYSSGLPYHRGEDQSIKGNPHQTLRQLFTELLSSKKPIVLHNGLVDMVFLYQSFYAPLPQSLATFLADLTEMFPGGVYDTKYITEFHARLSASYLEYVFRKQQRINEENKLNQRSHISVGFPKYPDSVTIEYRNCMLCRGAGSSDVCSNYAQHGWCSKGSSCHLSHNIDDILDVEFSKRNQKSKKRKKKGLVQEINQIVLEEANHIFEIEKTEHTAPGGHRAGYDAFMTGFAFATFFQKYGNKIETNELAEYKNKIYLCGKDAPLLIMVSQFGKTSQGHNVKWKKIGCS